jgi:hypothetical protein
MGILKNGMHVEASISFFKTFTIIFFPKYSIGTNQVRIEYQGKFFYCLLK